MARNQFENSPDAEQSQARSQRASASELPAFTYRTGRSQLGAEFQPSKYSVICGRGKSSYNHNGNYRLRSLASTFVANYLTAGRKLARSAIISDIVALIRQEGGCFCKFEEGSWFEVGDECAREKVGSFFRDKLHNHYRSSSKAKTVRRRVAQRAQRKQYGAQTQQYGIEDSDDSSMLSACSGSSKDSLGYDHSMEIDFFDIDVF